MCKLSQTSLKIYQRYQFYTHTNIVCCSTRREISSEHGSAPQDDVIQKLSSYTRNQKG